MSSGMDIVVHLRGIVYVGPAHEATIPDQRDPIHVPAVQVIHGLPEVHLIRIRSNHAFPFLGDFYTLPFNEDTESSATMKKSLVIFPLSREIHLWMGDLVIHSPIFVSALLPVSWSIASRRIAIALSSPMESD